MGEKKKGYYGITMTTVKMEGGIGLRQVLNSLSDNVHRLEPVSTYRVGHGYAMRWGARLNYDHLKPRVRT